MDPNQVTQVFNRCTACGAVVSPSDAKCARCGRRLADAVERTMVLPRVDPVDGSLASPQTTMPLPAFRPTAEPAYARPRGATQTVRAARRGPRLLPLLLLVLLLAVGGSAYMLGTRPLTGGSFEPARPLPPATQPPAAANGPAPAANPASGAPNANPAAQLAGPAPASPNQNPAPAPAQWVVANTNGDGVYLRRTPRLDDRLVAWPDKTPMVDMGEEASGDGQTWRKVRDPRGNVGYVPTQWLVPAAGR